MSQPNLLELEAPIKICGGWRGGGGGGGAGPAAARQPACTHACAGGPACKQAHSGPLYTNTHTHTHSLRPSPPLLPQQRPTPARAQGTCTASTRTCCACSSTAGSRPRPTTCSWATTWTAGSRAWRPSACCWPSRCRGRPGCAGSGERGTPSALAHARTHAGLLPPRTHERTHTRTHSPPPCPADQVPGELLPPARQPRVRLHQPHLRLLRRVQAAVQHPAVAHLHGLLQLPARVGAHRREGGPWELWEPCWSCCAPARAGALDQGCMQRAGAGLWAHNVHWWDAGVRSSGCGCGGAFMHV